MIDSNQLYGLAIAALNQQNWPQAIQLSSQLLALAPMHGGSHYILGVACLEQRNLAMAIRHARRAVELEPAQPDFIAQYAKALATARMNGEARAMADRARMLSPLNSTTLSILGSVYQESNQHFLSLEMFRKAAEIEPNVAHRRYNLATSLISTGDISDARLEIEKCLLLNPKFWKAHLALAHLQRQSVDDNHLKRLTSLLLHNESDHEARIFLHMALAKEYENLAMHSKAFYHLVQGKSESRKDIKYTIEQDEVLFAALERALPEAIHQTGGNASHEPIFVFGMPRTGTTLVDRILSSHSDVYSAGELQNFGVALRRAWGSALPLWLDHDIANRTLNVDWQKVGDNYIESTRPLTGHTHRFIDKLPHNFLYAGFIAKAFPNAKMICLRRDPVDTCFSNFQQLFLEKLPYYHYSFDLLDTGKYYVLFDCLMQHWLRTLPGRIFELRYEDLVYDQEATTRRLLDFCGLEWNEACLHFETNQAAVGTASALQVRQPLYSSSIGRWKHYQPQLRNLLDFLTQSDIEFSL